MYFGVVVYSKMRFMNFSRARNMVKSREHYLADAGRENITFQRKKAGLGFFKNTSMEVPPKHKLFERHDNFFPCKTMFSDKYVLESQDSCSLFEIDFLP